jgi:glycerol-3-phosphate acyltransferase PlsX
MVKIAVDAMGGDRAPDAVVEGALLAAGDLDVEVVLVGRQEIIEPKLARRPHASAVRVVNASEVVAMDESPSTAIRKRDSSLKVAYELMNRGDVQAVVSAGNSGAMMAVGMIAVGKLPQVDRPAISVVLPSGGKGTVIIDAGANVDCKPRQLVQFAMMGAIYSQEILGVTSPRVGVLSNGEEDSKGNDLTRAASDLLAQSSLNYIGYVEGRDFFSGKVDVVVCDGFTGNVALKTLEGLAGFIGGLLKDAFHETMLSRVGYLMSRGPLMRAYRRLDYREYGGAPLLGLSGVAIVAHGGSGPKEIKNAIRVAKEAVAHDVNRHIMELIVQADSGEVATSPGIWQRVKSKLSGKTPGEAPETETKSGGKS